MRQTSGEDIVETSKGGRGLRDLALGELERERAVGRERSAQHAPEVVPGEAGMLGENGDRVGGVEQAEWIYSSGIKLSLCEAVVARRVQRATLSTAPVSGTLDCLDRISDLGSLLLRQCKGSVKQLTSCLLYTSPSPRDGLLSRMPSSA